MSTRDLLFQQKQEQKMTSFDIFFLASVGNTKAATGGVLYIKQLVTSLESSQENTCAGTFF